MDIKQAPYEAPTIEVVGKLHEVTKSGQRPNSDQLPFENNTAFGPDS